MHIKIIRVVKTSTDSDMPTNEEETFQERKLEISARISDASPIPVPAHYAPTGKQFVPDHIRIKESFTAYTPDDGNPAHYRVVVVSGFVVRKDGTVGKLRVEEHFRTYSSATTLAGAPQVVLDAAALLVSPFQRGTFAQVQA